MQVWSAPAVGSPSDGDRVAEQLVPADRFAREIIRFLKRPLERSRQLNGNPLGGSSLLQGDAKFTTTAMRFGTRMTFC